MQQEGREGWVPTDAASDHFLMFGYKIVTCPRRYSHDWISCPYAHSGESARRREPHLYKPIPCPESKGGQPCPRGESCKYAHNDFEYWLHPSRFKTEICKQGPGCSRKVCFFAHQPHEIRKPGDGFMGDHFMAAFGKHGKKQKPSPFDLSLDYVPPTPRGITATKMKRKAHLQARAEMQLEEALHQLRLPQGPPASMSPRMMGAQQDSWILPALDGMGYQHPDTLANLQAVLDTPCGTPPSHLMGYEGSSLNTWGSPSPRVPPTIGFQDARATSYLPSVSIGYSLQVPESSPGLFTGSPVAPRTPTNHHQVLELGLGDTVDLRRHSSPFGMDEGSPVIHRHMHDFSNLAGVGGLSSPAGGGFTSPAGGLSSPAGGGFTSPAGGLRSPAGGGGFTSPAGGFSSSGLSSPGLGSPSSSRNLWTTRGGMQDSARMMSHGSLGLGPNKMAGTSPGSTGSTGFLGARPSWHIGDSPRLPVGTNPPLGGFIQTASRGVDIQTL